MAENIHLIAYCAVRPGKSDLAQKGIDEVVRYCSENEPGLLLYEFFFSEDGTELQVIETYENVQAIRDHNTDGHNAAFLEAIEIRRVSFFGDVPDDLVEAWEDLNPTVFSHIGGFARPR